jgi:hypothetical protein
MMRTVERPTSPGSTAAAEFGSVSVSATEYGSAAALGSPKG